MGLSSVCCLLFRKWCHGVFIITVGLTDEMWAEQVCASTASKAKWMHVSVSTKTFHSYDQNLLVPSAMCKACVNEGEHKCCCHSQALQYWCIIWTVIFTVGQRWIGGAPVVVCFPFIPPSDFRSHRGHFKSRTLDSTRDITILPF